MTRWDRAIRDQWCGRCGHRIATGDPVFVLTLQSTEKVRCATCEGPAPPDLPALVERAPIDMPRMVRFAAGAMALPLDWKARSAGDREVGEEG